MKKIMISGKEYTIEFTLKATLLDDEVAGVMDTLIGYEMFRAKVEAMKQENAVTPDNAEETVSDLMRDYVRTNVGVPKKAVSLFYAGLVEHHGNEIFSKEEALKLLDAYISENAGKTLYDVFGEMIDIAAEDNFFEKAGYGKMFENMDQKNQKSPKKPQDHKKVGEN